MHFTRPRELAIAGVIGLGAAYLLFELVYSTLPRLPTLAGTTLLILAVIELVLAFSVRGRIRAGRVLGALMIARAVALAKASSLLGSLMAGAWVGVLGYLLPRADRITAAENDLPGAVIGVCCAVALTAAALWLEHCCRTPEPRDSDRPPGATG
ncbi:DUF3180 domain-containing protein [Amycolatopsis cihanbeyliensis]|uniref:Uncharacterized protein DUF3180 n=1 Tax=Amycolatopsis cihanbeyliensis TaxID=1128664 RepID=A0A542DN48_AMYCI|nr:DUF3180 domain-containing protein [Amycolatopsis cihanbeyliensis]TQJ04513.1 uncharacterized protein DUF3180 [Amycolatopsis cihanbeyliensis]